MLTLLHLEFNLHGHSVTITISIVIEQFTCFYSLLVFDFIHDLISLLYFILFYFLLFIWVSLYDSFLEQL